MNKIKIGSFQDFIDHIEGIEIIGHEINLYRGQSTNEDLLPAVARKCPKKDTTEIEIQMLEDLKRRSNTLINQSFDSEWELLVYAQHFGLKTRLLDWSSNPLIALWFACQNEYKIRENSYLYILSVDNNMLVDLAKNPSPFKNESTRILKPSLNNKRIVAQSGWFTAHKYSKLSKRFVALNANIDIQNRLTEIEIPAKIKREIISKLSIFGVNNSTVFPDVAGLCLDLNWKYVTGE